jgi:acyl carrier protein
MKTDELIAAISEALSLDIGEITLDSKQEDFQEWDSLGHLSILQSLDEKTSGKLDRIKEIGKATSVKEIFEAMKQAGLISE